jgi:hypothetical protein
LGQWSFLGEHAFGTDGAVADTYIKLLIVERILPCSSDFRLLFAMEQLVSAQYLGSRIISNDRCFDCFSGPKNYDEFESRIKAQDCLLFELQ